MKTRRYLIKYKNSPNEIFEVPEDWKVTYGPLVPGSGYHDNQSTGFTLRFYETKDKQRAVFTGVVAFRQLDDVRLLRRVGKDRIKEIMEAADGPVPNDQLAKVGQWEEVTEDLAALEESHLPNPDGKKKEKKNGVDDGALNVQPGDVMHVQMSPTTTTWTIMDSSGDIEFSSQ